MDDFVRTIFQNAVMKEKAAREMYINMSDMAKIPGLKQMFLDLAEEEMMHEHLFSKANIDTLKIVNKAEISKIGLLKNIKKSDLLSYQIDAVNESLDFAIKEEQKAFDDYSLLLRYIDFGDVKETFEEIAKQEMSHKIRLEKVRKDFNKDDWDIFEGGI